MQKHGVAYGRRAPDGGDRPGKNPRMPLLERLLAPGLQGHARERHQVPPTDGCATPMSGGCQVRLTPNSRPTPNVTAAAKPPSNSMRAPEKIAPRPVNSDNVAPTAKSASAVSAALIGNARAPAPKMKGSSGIAAPMAKESNDDTAAPHGEPSSSGLRPSSSRASVSSACSGSETSCLATRLASTSLRPFAWEIKGSSRA